MRAARDHEPKEAVHAGSGDCRWRTGQDDEFRQTYGGITRIPRSPTHLASSVPDITAATSWYREVLGCYLLVEPGEARNDGTHFGNVVKDIFGDRLESVL